MSQLTFNLTLLRYSERDALKYVLFSALFITVTGFLRFQYIVLQMVSRKLQVSETFHSISKSLNGICNESRSLLFDGFLESRNFELFAVKSLIFKQGLGVSASLGFIIHHPYLAFCLKL